MVSSHKKVRARPIVRDEDRRPFPWLELVLAVSFAALLLQLFPAAWWSLVSLAAVVFSYVDVRGWTWRSYAVICVVAILVLTAARAWQGSRDNR
jgi:hypothetical protein